MGPLRQAYLSGLMSSFAVRWAYGLTMMSIIFSTAMAMAAIMAAIQWVWLRASSARQPTEERPACDIVLGDEHAWLN